MNFRGAWPVTVAGIAAAVLLSACGNGGDAVTRTDGTASGPATAAASDLTALLAAPADAFEKALAAPAVTGTAPGAFVTSPTGSRCTLGPAVTAKDGRPAFLTAGHCAKPGTASAAGTPLGSYDDAREKADDDSTIIVTAEAAGDTVIAGLPVAGSLTAEQAVGLPSGATVCFQGAVSGVVCGEKFSSSRESVMVDAIAQAGDSGGPVFVKFRSRAWLVGIVSRANNVDLTATPIGNALMTRGASAQIAP